MANPKYKMSRASTRARRNSIKLLKPNISTCPNCKADTLPHRVCASCGFYKGRDIFKTEEKAKK